MIYTSSFEKIKNNFQSSNVSAVIKLPPHYEVASQIIFISSSVNPYNSYTIWSISLSVLSILVLSAKAFFLLSSNNSIHSNSSFLVNGVPLAVLMALFSSLMKSTKDNSYHFSSFPEIYFKKIKSLVLSFLELIIFSLTHLL
jgi:hypothetical protein